MPPKPDNIAKKIESGEYFSEGMNWFHTKFTRARTEFAYFFIVCVIAVMALLVGIAAFSEIFPLSPGKNFVLGREIGASEHLTIHSISNKGDTANDSVMKFMLSQYVQAREEYIEEKLDRNFRVVTSLSSNDVYSKFLDETSTSNPQNPVILYGKQATRDVRIDGIKLEDSLGKQAHDAQVARAIVNYTTILTFLNDNTTQIAPHEADITFQYTQITVDQKTGKISQRPQMQITDYKTIELKPQQAHGKI